MYLHEDLEKGYFTSDRKKYFYDGSLENPQLWLTVNWDRLQSRNVSQHSQVSTSQADSYITSWSGVPLHLWRLYQHFRRDALSWCRASQWSPHHLAPPCYIVTGAPPIKALHREDPPRCTLAPHMLTSVQRADWSRKRQLCHSSKTLHHHPHRVFSASGMDWREV